MNKEGQFYLMAAIIIVAIMVSLTGVSTYVLIHSQPRTIADVSEDLERESYEIIAYGVRNRADVASMLTNFSGEHSEYFLRKIGNNSNILFIYGNKTNVTVLQYTTNISGEVRLGSASWKNYKPKVKIKEIKKSELAGQQFIDVDFLGNVYSFQLRDHQLFYFIVGAERDDEVFIEKNNKIYGTGGAS